MLPGALAKGLYSPHFGCLTCLTHFPILGSPLPAPRVPCPHVPAVCGEGDAEAREGRSPAAPQEECTRRGRLCSAPGFLWGVQTRSCEPAGCRREPWEKAVCSTCFPELVEVVAVAGCFGRPGERFAAWRWRLLLCGGGEPKQLFKFWKCRVFAF